MVVSLGKNTAGQQVCNSPAYDGQPSSRCGRFESGRFPQFGSCRTAEPVAEIDQCGACDRRSDFVRRTAPGENPRKRLNARLKAASDS